MNSLMAFVFIDLNLFLWDTNLCLLEFVGFLINLRCKMFFFLQVVSRPDVIHSFRGVRDRLFYIEIGKQ